MKKVEKRGIVLVASINSFHGNVLPEAFEKIHAEELGLGILAESGLNLTINCHEIDFLMYPWLGKYQEYSNLQFSGGLFSHILPALCSKEHLDWQERSGIINPTVSFYPEFCAPSNPNRNFWLLDSQAHYYSQGYLSEQPEVFWNSEEVGTLPSVIKVNEAYGFVMKEKSFKPILSLMFLAQRFPDITNAAGMTNLDLLVKAIAEVNEVVFVPFDLEAPYIGSKLGKNFWERLISKIKENGLEDRFLNFKEISQSMILEATEISDTPHRNLSKWISVEAMFDYFSELKACSKMQLSEADHKLLAFANCADIAAAVYQKSLYARRPINLAVVDSQGIAATVKISGNKEIIDLCYLARKIFLARMKNPKTSPNLKLWKELNKKTNDGLFWGQLISVTKKMDI